MQKRVSICCLAVLFTVCFSPIDKSYAMKRFSMGNRVGTSITTAREDDLSALSVYELYKSKREVEELKKAKAYFVGEGWRDYVAKDDTDPAKGKYAWVVVPGAGASEPFGVAYGALFGKMSTGFFRGATLGMRVPLDETRDTEGKWVEIRQWALTQRLEIDDSTRRIRCRNCSKERVYRIYDDLNGKGWGRVIDVEYFSKPFGTAGANAMAAAGWDLDRMQHAIKAEIANREDRRMREAEAVDE